MDKQESVKFWTESAKRNRKSAIDNFEMKHYDWCLFIWHLCLEKLIKARIVENREEVPLMHNLVSLCKIANIKLTEEEKMELSEINTYNVEARYESIKMALYKKATPVYTKKWLDICEKYYKKFKNI